MTLPRGLFITVLIGAIGIAIVLLRQSMASTSYRIQQEHQQCVRLEQDLWARQMELARLRIPASIRDRVDGLGLDVQLPKIERKATRQHGAITTHD